MSVLLIGDSHLEQCHIAAEKSAKADFGYDSLKVTWHYQKNEVKSASKFYKENISGKETPDVVVIMCGRYDIYNGNTVTDVVNKLKDFINYLSGMPIKYIIVCSIIEIKVQSVSENDANKTIRATNKALAKAFKNMNKVIFINVRPPGNINVISEDKLHLKPESYSHIYRRVLNTLEEQVLPNLPNVPKKEVKIQVNNCSIKESNYKKECSIESRKAEFKEILIQDYKRVCVTENDLTKKFDKVEHQLQEVSKEKNEIVSVYKKLFDSDITKED